jgi:hypothetical protein
LVVVQMGEPILHPVSCYLQFKIHARVLSMSVAPSVRGHCAGHYASWLPGRRVAIVSRVPCCLAIVGHGVPLTSRPRQLQPLPPFWPLLFCTPLSPAAVVMLPRDRSTTSRCRICCASVLRPLMHGHLQLDFPEPSPSAPASPPSSLLALSPCFRPQWQFIGLRLPFSNYPSPWLHLSSHWSTNPVVPVPGLSMPPIRSLPIHHDFYGRARPCIAVAIFCSPRTPNWSRI